MTHDDCCACYQFFLMLLLRQYCWALWDENHLCWMRRQCVNNIICFCTCNGRPSGTACLRYSSFHSLLDRHVSFDTASAIAGLYKQLLLEWQRWSKWYDLSTQHVIFRIKCLTAPYYVQITLFHEKQHSQSKNIFHVFIHPVKVHCGLDCKQWKIEQLS